MSWNTFFSALGGTATALVVAGGGLSLTGKFCLDWFIKKYEIHHAERIKNLEKMLELAHNKFLKDYEFQLKTREKAAGVAELLTMADEPQGVSNKEFNRLAWELSLWLPPDIVCELSHCLCKSEQAKHPKEILILVRKMLLGPDDTLVAENIVHRERLINDKGGSRDETTSGVSPATD